MLHRAMDTSDSVIDWAPTAEGRKAAQEWAEKYAPLPSGYYRAYYLRIVRDNYGQHYIEEHYSYSPDPEKEATVLVILRDKPGPPYSGNLKADLLIAEGDSEKVKELLAKGADVNSRNKRGDTALMSAVLSARRLDMVKALLDGGADVKITRQTFCKFVKS